MADAVITSGVASREKVRVINNGIDIDAYRQPGNTAAIRVY